MTTEHRGLENDEKNGTRVIRSGDGGCACRAP